MSSHPPAHSQAVNQCPFMVKIGLGWELVNPIYHRNLLFFRGKAEGLPFYFNINQAMGIWDIYYAVNPQSA